MDYMMSFSSLFYWGRKRVLPKTRNSLKMTQVTLLRRHNGTDQIIKFSVILIWK